MSEISSNPLAGMSPYDVHILDLVSALTNMGKEKGIPLHRIMAVQSVFHTYKKPPARVQFSEAVNFAPSLVKLYKATEALTELGFLEQAYNEDKPVELIRREDKTHPHKEKIFNITEKGFAALRAYNLSRQTPKTERGSSQP